MSGIMPEDFEDKNPRPFTTIDPKDEHRKKFTTLYGGLFQEVFVTKEFEQYGHFIFQTSTNKLTLIDTSAQTGFLIDPVAFAYDFGARMFDSDRKSTRLNSSHVRISYAVFCWKKKSPRSRAPACQPAWSARSYDSSPCDSRRAQGRSFARARQPSASRLQSRCGYARRAWRLCS